MEITKYASETLCQLKVLLKALDNDQYAEPLSVLGDTSLGKHIRHTIEFYHGLFAGIPLGIVDYDKRERNITLETERLLALQHLSLIEEQLMRMQDGPIFLQVRFGAEVSLISTSVFREITYNMEHCIHHMAIIKMGVKAHFPLVHVPEHFGLAYSTLEFQKSQTLQPA